MSRRKKVAGIYGISSIPNKKIYVGYSTHIFKRWDDHKSSLRKNSHKNPHLQSAWSLYGEDSFSFNVLETLPLNLTKEQYEEVETKWVLHFNSHLSEFGYNSVLPGFRPSKEEGVNTTQRQLTRYVCINSLSGEVLHLSGTQAVKEVTSISLSKVEDLSAYWKGKNRKKSLHGWMIIKEEEHDESFDYINYKKEKPSAYKYGSKYTATEYYRIRKALDPTYQQKRKDPKDIIPRKDRNLKRVSILAHNILTGEDRVFPMIKSCYPEFCLMKVRKCINNEFKKYKHRGHWFKRI